MEEEIEAVQQPIRSRARTHTILEETLDVEIRENLSVRITCPKPARLDLSLIHISEPTRPY